MSISASTMIDKDSAASSGDLWEPFAVLLADWRTSLRVDSLWPNEITPGRSLAEQRYVRSDKPLRSQRVDVTGAVQDDVRALTGQAQRMGRARSLWPLFPDIVHLTGPVTNDPSIIGGDFSKLRYSVGGRVLIVKPDPEHGGTVASQVGQNSGVPYDDMEVRTISAVSDTQITLDAPLDYSESDTPDVGASATDLDTATNSSTFAFNIPVGRVCMVFVQKAMGSPGVPTTSSVTYGTSPATATKFADITNTASTMQLELWIFTSLDATGNITCSYSGTVDDVRCTAIYYDTVAFPVDPPPNNTDTDQDTVTNASSGGPTVTPSFARSRILVAHAVDAAYTQDIDAGGGTEIRDDSTTIGMMLQHVDVGFNFAPRNMTADLGAPGTQSQLSIGFEIPSTQAVDDDGQTVWDCYPAIECDLSLETRLKALTDYVMQGTFLCDETAGPTALEALVTPGTNPSGFDTYNSLPIYDLASQYRGGMGTGARRDGKASTVGQGRAFDVYGSKSRVSTTVQFVGRDRDESRDLLRFIDSRAGSAYPFYILSPLTEFDFAGTGGDIQTGGGPTILLKQSKASEYDWADIDLIVFEHVDGTLYFKVPTFVIRFSNFDRISIDTNLPSSVTADYKRICRAHLVRFDQDNFRERWQNSDILQMDLSMIEVINEKSVTVTPDVPCGPGVCGDGWDFDPPDLCVGRCTGTSCDFCIDYIAVTVVTNHWCIPCPGEGICQLNSSETSTFSSPTCLSSPNRLVWSTPHGDLTLNLDTAAWTIPAGLQGSMTYTGCPDDATEVDCVPLEPEGCEGVAPDSESCTAASVYLCCLGEWRLITDISVTGAY